MNSSSTYPIYHCRPPTTYGLATIHALQRDRRIVPKSRLNGRPKIRTTSNRIDYFRPLAHLYSAIYLSTDDILHFRIRSSWLPVRASASRNMADRSRDLWRVKSRSNRAGFLPVALVQSSVKLTATNEHRKSSQWQQWRHCVGKM